MKMIRNRFFPLTLVCLFLLFFYMHNKPDDTATVSESINQINFSEISPPSSEQKVETEQIYFVDIKGEVQKPGVYQVPSSLRVKDIVEKAGGFTKDANQKSINLAQKIYDEMVIMVSSINDSPTAENEFNFTNSTKIRINQASQSEIETLPGIGPQKAQQIINYREENGPFKNVKDLLKVSGIGEKTLEKLEDFIIAP